MARDWEQVTGQLPPKRENRAVPAAAAAAAPGPAHPAAAPPPAAEPVGREQPGSRRAGTQAGHRVARHDPGEETATWAELRAWVTWLYDRYELSVEDRLPRCWARHPGLVEELYALKAWRQEIYSGGQPSGQAARYWHAELRQVLHAAATQYALGCRTGHRGTRPACRRRPGLAAGMGSCLPAGRGARHRPGRRHRPSRRDPHPHRGNRLRTRRRHRRPRPRHPRHALLPGPVACPGRIRLDRDPATRTWPARTCRTRPGPASTRDHRQRRKAA